VRTPARIAPYPTGRLFWGGAIPGTSCQATIAPSLRDISQQAVGVILAIVMLQMLAGGKGIATVAAGSPASVLREDRSYRVLLFQFGGDRPINGVRSGAL
jgi:hypothetical protein